MDALKKKSFKRDTNNFSCGRCSYLFNRVVPPQFRLEVLFENISQVEFVSNAGFTIGVNGNIVCVDAYARTADIRKIVDGDLKKFRNEIRALSVQSPPLALCDTNLDTMSNTIDGVFLISCNRASVRV